TGGDQVLAIIVTRPAVGAEFEAKENHAAPRAGSFEIAAAQFQAAGGREADVLGFGPRLTARRDEQRNLQKAALDELDVVYAQVIKENDEQNGDDQRKGEKNGDAGDDPPHELTPRKAASGSIGEPRDNQRHILPAEAEAIAQDMIDAFFAGGVGDVVEVAIRVGCFVIDRRRDDAAANGHDAGDQFGSAGGGDQVAEHALAAGDRNLAGLLAEDLFDGQGFNAIIDLGAGAVGVDITDIVCAEPAIGKRPPNGSDSA